jgi:hypothetical protein
MLLDSYAYFCNLSINIHASCRISPNTIGNQEGSPSFFEANPSSSLEQGKHHAYPFIRAFALKHFTLC